MKIVRRMAAILAIACLISACGGSAGGGGPGSPAGSVAGEVPSAIKAMLDETCGTRPTPLAEDSEIGGQRLNYAEVLAEEDVGSSISDASKLSAGNINGTLRVKTSSDGNVYWAARKWTLSETMEKAESELENVAISSDVKDNAATVDVSQPDSVLPGTRYETCLVIMAPSDWPQSSNNESGNIEIQNMSGDVIVETASGDIIITQHTGGTIGAKTQSGDISIDTASDKEVTVSSQSGNIAISTSGSGKITSTNVSGDLEVNADSRVAVDLQNRSGDIHYTLTNGGVPYQYDGIVSSESGSIALDLADGFGLHLDAEVLTGSIEVPAAFPAPAPSGVTGEKLVADINGGGAALTIRSTTGTISIDTLN